MDERLSNREAAKYLRVSENTMNVWRNTKRWPNLPYLKMGSKVYYWKKDLDAFLEAQTITAEA